MSEKKFKFKRLEGRWYEKSFEVVEKEKEERVVVFVEREVNVFERPVFRVTAFIRDDVPDDFMAALEAAFRDWVNDSTVFSFVEKVVLAASSTMKDVSYKIKIEYDSNPDEKTLSAEIIIL
ncbi:MAG: hypothetical protein QXS63_05565 [Zestosphaera sp.]